MKQRAIKGVNLGGWLVLEPWITPSLFRPGEADELGLSHAADDKRRGELKRFRETFITKKDFQWLAQHGIEAVRIPVGYWIFGDAAPFVGAIDFLDKAFDWAEAYGIKILICLHGAPDSQNGKMHSGNMMHGQAEWHKDRRNLERTVQAVERLASRYAERANLLGIELLNEPSNEVPRRLLRTYYRQAYKKVRYYCGPDSWVVINDGLNPHPWRWSWHMHRPLYRNVYQDTHSYQAFTPADIRLDLPGHIALTKGRVARRLRILGWYRRMVVGEWSAVLDPQSVPGLTGEALNQAYTDYIKAQLVAYGRAEAWFYWTYRTEGAGPWSFRQMVEQAVFPDLKSL
jgi:glucan 1,3-beta-glucosidase